MLIDSPDSSQLVYLQQLSISIREQEIVHLVTKRELRQRNAPDSEQIKDIFRLLREYSGVPGPKWYRTFSRFEIGLISTTVGSFILCFVVALVGRHTRHPEAFFAISRILLLVSILGAWGLQLWSILSSFKLIFRPTQSFLEIQEKIATFDYGLLRALSCHPKFLLKYVYVQLNSSVEQTRGRMGTWAGALDKVGIIPLLLGWIFSGQKMVADLKIDRTHILTATAAFGIFYVMSVSVMWGIYRIEQFVKLLELASDEDFELPDCEFEESEFID
jgi:hypothetical protein